MILPRTVLLLKSQTAKDTDDKYANLLIQNDFKVEHAKTLVFEFKNIELLREKLERKDSYDGLIFSSPRCVQAAQLAAENRPDLLTNWDGKRNYVVGDATYKEALDKLGLDCEGKESGNAENLARFIMQNKNLMEKGFLFPHGNLKIDTFNRELVKEGIGIKGVLVYDTIPNPEIKQQLSNITKDFQDIPEFIVFFSPSGLHSSIDVLRKVPEFINAKLIAIGPVTELAMKEYNLEVFGIAKHPNAEEILNIILGR